MDKFSIGRVLGTGLRVWARNVIPFLFITALVYTPFIVWAVLLVQGNPAPAVRLAELERLTRAIIIFVPLLNILASSALVYGVVMDLSGQRASIFRCIGTGLARFFPVLGVALLTMLAVLGGLLMIVIPGIIVMCMLYVAPGVAVLERPGLIGALKRSHALTAGHRMGIFAILLLLVLFNMGLTEVVEIAMTSGTQITPDNFHDFVRRYIYVELGRMVLVGSLSAVMVSTAYFYLRREKEGTNADELSAVFE